MGTKCVNFMLQYRSLGRIGRIRMPATTHSLSLQPDFGGTLGFGSSVLTAPPTTAAPPLSRLPEFKGRPQLQQGGFGVDYFASRHGELDGDGGRSGAQRSGSMPSALDFARA